MVGLVSQGFISLHPVLLQVVLSGLWAGTQIIALQQGATPRCVKAKGRSETESYVNECGDF